MVSFICTIPLLFALVITLSSSSPFTLQTETHLQAPERRLLLRIRRREERRVPRAAAREAPARVAPTRGPLPLPLLPHLALLPPRPPLRHRLLRRARVFS